MFDYYLYWIIKVNGIYDILCSLCILDILDIPILRDLHLSMVLPEQRENPIFQRFYAYWIFTYGVIRLSNDRYLIGASYLLEAAFYFHEMILGTVYFDKSIFVIISSVILSIFVFIFYPFSTMSGPFSPLSGPLSLGARNTNN